MWSTMLAMVVLFPDPVGPVTRISPREASEKVRSTSVGSPSVSKLGMLSPTTRMTMPTAPRCRKMLQRNRPMPETL